MEYAAQGPLHEMFQRQAKDTPDAPAVVSVLEGKEVTFAELDQWSGLLAAALQQRGAAPDRCVAICLDKSIDFAVAYIAVLKAGAAYLPLDTAYPAHMLESVLDDALPVVVITSLHFESTKLKNVLDKVKTLVLKDGWTNEMPKLMSPKLVPPAVHLDNLAFVVYSSGTTGKPKGIQCPHRGAVFSYHSRHTLFPYGEDEREACNIFFVWEMLRPLLKGVPMYPFPNSVIYDPPLLCKHVQSNAITRMLFTPSLLETLLNSPDLDLPTSFKSMRQIWFCGEVVTTSLLKRCVAALPWVRFINLYSVSECHDVACADLSEYYEKNRMRYRVASPPTRPVAVGTL